MNSILLYVLKPVGAPSATAVIALNDNENFVNWERISKKCCAFLKANDTKLSKIAILGQKESGTYPFKFVQVRKKLDGMMGFETGYDCGNSMTAAGYIASIISGEPSIEVANIDTKLKVLLTIDGDNINFSVIYIVKNRINEVPWYAGSELVSLYLQDRQVNITLINICNPYILVNATSLNVDTVKQLLSFNNNTADDILSVLEDIRSRVIEQMNLDADSEFPKIAIVHNRELLAARTIYLNKWHDGLPLTAAISILAARKIEHSVIHSLDNKDYILMTKGKRYFSFELDDENQKIAACNFFNIKLQESYTKYQIDCQTE